MAITTIDKIDIKSFFSIDNIEISGLRDKKEIYIVGENGDGKTLLLQAIIVGLVGVKEGDVFNLIKSEKNYNVSIDNRDLPLVAYGSSRNNYCQIKEDTTGYLTLFGSGYDLKSPIKWLIDLYNAQNAREKTIISLDDAIRLLQKLLNRDIKIEVNYKSLTFTEKESKVSFDQLSAGYRGVITIICDLISRFSERQDVENIADFQGVVLIDEVELHLHPKWQYSFMQKLRETFPLIQFIVTTHSPTVLLGADNNAIFYKVYKNNGKTKISAPIDNIRNFMANTLTTSPLFDMDTARARNSDIDIDTSEDYIYSKIHESIAKRVKGKNAIIEDDIVEIIDQELDLFLKENNL